MDLKEKARRCREFLDALDEERRKVLVFHRELPLCLNLINQTIESYRRMFDVVALTSDEEPVLQEFISLKPSSNLEKEDQSTDDHENKKDWITNLCIQEPDSVHKPADLLEKPVLAVTETKESSDDLDHINANDIIHESSICKEKEISNAEAISTAAGGAGGSCSDADHEEDDKYRNQRRKTRRCWSEDLHRKFSEAIDQLGGCHAATPRQIRELMNVEGLTNDEVKSHLQKFRLHWKRRPVTQNQSRQFVVGIWIPPPDYAAAAAAVGAATSAEADRISSSNIVCSSQANTNMIFSNGYNFYGLDHV